MVLDAHPSTYQKVLSAWISEHTNIQCVLDAKVTGATPMAAGGYKLKYESSSGPHSVAADVLVDATGVGSLCQMVDPTLLSHSGARAAAGLVLRFVDAESGAMEFPRNVGAVRAIRAAVQARSLPSEAATVWLDQGPGDGEVYAKMMIDLPQDWRDSGAISRIREGAIGTCESLSIFLQTLPHLRSARLAEIGALGIRDGGSIRGEYTLTGNDVRSGATFKDTAGRACWPIERWVPGQGIKMEFLPEGSAYEIPLRALRAAGYENLWCVGRCISADEEAQASARVVGTLWALGESVGKSSVSGFEG